MVERHFLSRTGRRTAFGWPKGTGGRGSLTCTRCRHICKRKRKRMYRCVGFVAAAGHAAAGERMGLRFLVPGSWFQVFVFAGQGCTGLELDPHCCP